MSIKPAYPNSSGSGGGGSGNDPTKLPLAGGTMNPQATITLSKIVIDESDSTLVISGNNIGISDAQSENSSGFSTGGFSAHDNGSGYNSSFGAGGWSVASGALQGSDTGITFPDASVQMSAAVTQVTDFDGTETSSNDIGYDLELVINFNGTLYKVPAREYTP
jgi:hypothetical protein